MWIAQKIQSNILFLFNLKVLELEMINNIQKLVLNILKLWLKHLL